MSQEVQSADEATTAGSGPGGGGFFYTYGPLLKHWLIFLVVLGSLVAFRQWKADWVNVKFAEFTASIMAWILDMFGIHGKAHGVHVTSSVCRFRIIGECTAYYPMAIFVASVMAFPSRWSRRILGVLLGIPAMLLINQVRLVSLCYLLRAYPEQFDTLHIVVWQSLIIFFTVMLWIVWVMTLARSS